MINHNPESIHPTRRRLDPYSDLNYQCVDDSFDLKVRQDYLTLGLRDNGKNSTARIMSFHLARNPEIAFLWNSADNYSNLLNPELSISCPFILTLTPVVEDREDPQRSEPEVHGSGEEVEDLLRQMVPVRGEGSEGVGDLRQRGVEPVLGGVLLFQYHGVLPRQQGNGAGNGAGYPEQFP